MNFECKSLSGRVAMFDLLRQKRLSRWGCVGLVLCFTHLAGICPAQTVGPDNGPVQQMQQTASEKDAMKRAVTGSKATNAAAVALQTPELVLQRGNSGAVSGITFSCGGTLLATLDSAGDVQLWNPATGEVVRVLSTPGEGGLCAAFSPDNRTLAVGGSRGSVMIFSIETGQLLHKWPCHKDMVGSVSFFADGQKLASVGDDGIICLHDLASGILLKTFSSDQKKNERENRFVAVRFAPVNQTMVAVDSRGQLFQYDAQNFSFQKQWPGASRALAISPDGELIASLATEAEEMDDLYDASRDQTRQVQVWKFGTGELRYTLPVKSPISSLAFSTDGKVLLGAVGRGDDEYYQSLESYGKPDAGHILAWSMESGVLLKEYLDPGGQLHEVATVPVAANLSTTNLLTTAPTYLQPKKDAGNEWFASLSAQDGKVRLWKDSGPLKNTTEQAPERVLSSQWSTVSSLAVTPDGSSLAVADESGVQFWSLHSMKLVRYVHEEEGVKRTVVCSPTGTLFGTAVSMEDVASENSIDPQVRLYSPTGIKRHTTISKGNQGTPSTSGALAFSYDGRRIATSHRSRIFLYNVQTGKKIREWSGGEGGIEILQFLPPVQWKGVKRSSTPDDTKKTVEFMLGADRYEPGTLRVWNTTTGEWKRRLVTRGHWPVSVAASPDGRWLADGDLYGVVQLWDMRSAGLVSYPVRNIAAHGPMHPAGRTLEQKSQDMKDPGAQAVGAVAFSPDSHWLATGSDDTTVKIWEVPSGRLLRTLADTGGGVTGVAFVPGTKGLLVTGSRNGFVKLWDARTGRLLLSVYLVPASGKVAARQWLAWTPEGFYDGSPDAESLIRWRAGVKEGEQKQGGEQTLLPAAQYQKAFRRPDVIRALLGSYYENSKQTADSKH